MWADVLSRPLCDVTVWSLVTAADAIGWMVPHEMRRTLSGFSKFLLTVQSSWRIKHFSP